MSGPKIIGGQSLSEDQIAIIELLKETLAQALEGNFSTIGIVVCMKDGFASVMSGRQAADLNLACDDLKYKIHKAVTEGTTERATRRALPPTILRPKGH